MAKCKGTNSKGKPCQMDAESGSEYCRFHEPKKENDPTVQEATEELLDFSDTIARLDERAKRSRKRVRWVAGILFFAVYGMVSMIFWNFSNQERLTSISFRSFYDSDRSSVTETLERRVSMLTEQIIGPRRFKDGEKFTPPTGEKLENIQKQIDIALKDLGAAKKIYSNQKSISPSNDYSSAISSAVVSLGTVAFVVLLIQISVMFMRYHSRLAELYEAQADALRASGGSTIKAYTFMQHFSPNSIDLGRTPTTLYEKALDTVKEVAKGKKV